MFSSEADICKLLGCESYIAIALSIQAQEQENNNEKQKNQMAAICCTLQFSSAVIRYAMIIA